MSDLEKFKQWLATYPGAAAFEGMQVDYTDSVPESFGIFPSGLVEISRASDILGNTTAENQYNFALYMVFLKSPGDSDQATVNADWVMDFQKWVQRQSITRKAPVFGNIDTDQEKISAQNGVLYEAEQEGTAMYMVQISATYKTFYEEA